MRILIVYFSGTGNTAFLCRELAERLSDASLNVAIFTIKDIAPDQLPDHTLLVLGFPVYGLEPPPLVSDFVAAMPVVNERGAFVLTTQGVLAGGAPRRGLERLMTRGYTPLGHAAIDMPFSDGMMVMRKVNAYVARAQSRDYSGHTKLVALADRVVAMHLQLEKGVSLKSLQSGLPWGIPGLMATPVLGALMRAVYGLGAPRFFADERCARCGLCERICPTNNIHVTQRGVAFGDHCILCVRCLHQCPQEAIQFGALTRDKARWRGPGGTFRP